MLTESADCVMNRSRRVSSTRRQHNAEAKGRATGCDSTRNSHSRQKKEEEVKKTEIP